MELEFDVHITGGVLYDYLLRHTYSSMAGIMGSVVGALLIVAFFSKFNVILLICGVVILAYLPVNLFLQAQRQALQPVFKNPLHYKLSNEGIAVSQGEENQTIGWEACVKAVSSGSSIILYTGRNNAFIFPRKDLGDSLHALIEIISTHVEPSKVKIRM